jgi:hypothetical protein
MNEALNDSGYAQAPSERIHHVSQNSGTAKQKTLERCFRFRAFFSHFHVSRHAT